MRLTVLVAAGMLLTLALLASWLWLAHDSRSDRLIAFERLETELQIRGAGSVSPPVLDVEPLLTPEEALRLVAESAPMADAMTESEELLVKFGVVYEPAAMPVYVIHTREKIPCSKNPMLTGDPAGMDAMCDVVVVVDANDGGFLLVKWSNDAFCLDSPC